MSANWSRRSFAIAPLSTIFVAGLAVVACGDDDSVGPTGTPDSGTQQTDANVSPPTDGGNNTDATSNDAGDAGAGEPVTPLTTTKLNNAINPYGLTFASDGMLYVAGATNDGGTQKLAVWRIKDGAVDTTFGTNGVITTDIAGKNENGWDIAEVTPGNFIVLASTPNVPAQNSTEGGRVYLAKLTKGAGGDFTFDTPTMVEFENWVDGDVGGAWPGTSAPAYQTWGFAIDRTVANTPKVVVFASGAPAKVTSGTQRTDSDRWITRLLFSDLSRDPAFNNGKPFTSDSDGKNLGDNSRRGFVQADGTIVSGGYTNFNPTPGGPGNHHIVVIRLTNAGAADTTFGFGSTVPGETKVNPFLAGGGFAEAYGIGRQSSGRYVTTGYGTSNAEVPSKGVDLIATGILAGSLDGTFGKQGAFALQSEKDPGAGAGATPFEDRGRDLAVLPDDRTLHFGAYDSNAAIYLLDKNGKPDVSFGDEGVQRYSYTTNFFRGVVSSDGKRVAASTQSTTVTIDGGSVAQSLLVTLKVGQ